MIDEKQTYRDFGYTSSELTYGSGKPVWAICDDCGYDRIIEYKSFSTTNGRCLKCASTGENGRFYGKRHTDETKKKISTFRKGKYGGKNHPMYGADRSGKNNPFYGKTHSYESRRKSSKTKQNISDEEWNGFISYGKYNIHFNMKCKEYIRDKYNRECFFCGKAENDNILRTGNMQKLSVHHIDRNKQNASDTNLIPLCKHCHSIIHTDYYESIIIWLLNNVWNDVEL